MSYLKTTRNISRAFIRNIREYASILLLVVGASLSYVFITMGFWSIIGPLIGATVGAFFSTCYLGLRRFTRLKSHSTSDLPSLDVRIPIILPCLYLAAMFLLLDGYSHQRPVLMYPLFGGYAGLIAYQIARGEGHRRVVPQILVLAFVTYWSSQLLFPAGMYGPDTHYRYLPAIEEIYTTAHIPNSETIYAGHLAHAAEFSMVTGIEPRTGYFLLATLLLTSTLLLISTLDRVLPRLNSKIALYATLVYSIMSWTIGRGMHPNKLNFFYVIILLLGICTVQIYRLKIHSLTDRIRWPLIGLVSIPAIVFGHQFSAVAALIFLISIGMFVVVVVPLLSWAYRRVPTGNVLPFIILYFLAVIGNPLHQDALLFRLSRLITSLVQTESSSGGAGRYSELAIDVLIASTAAQTILFCLAIVGAIHIFRKAEWEYDLLIFWIGALSLLLVIGLLQNSRDTQPQRLYSLLGLFGFNICVGVVLDRLSNWGAIQIPRVSFDISRVIVAVLITLFAVTGLVSPVADTATSPVGDEIPHFRQYDTEQRVMGDLWLQQYASDANRIIDPNPDVPIEQTGSKTGVVNTSSLEAGSIYAYSSLVNRTGTIAKQGLSLGGRQFVFVPPPEEPTDEQIYTNGETIVFVRQ